MFARAARCTWDRRQTEAKPELEPSDPPYSLGPPAHYYPASLRPRGSVSEGWDTLTTQSSLANSALKQGLPETKAEASMAQSCDTLSSQNADQIALQKLGSFGAHYYPPMQAKSTVFRPKGSVSEGWDTLTTESSLANSALKQGLPETKAKASMAQSWDTLSSQNLDQGKMLKFVKHLAELAKKSHDGQQH